MYAETVRCLCAEAVLDSDEDPPVLPQAAMVGVNVKQAASSTKRQRGEMLALSITVWTLATEHNLKNPQLSERLLCLTQVRHCYRRS